MELTVQNAEFALQEAGKSNPGPWVDHSRYVALACRNIAERCEELDATLAYLCGLLHDIGRYPGVTSEKHLIDGYRYCMERGWKKTGADLYIACISHSGYPHLYWSIRRFRRRLSVYGAVYSKCRV